MAGNLNKPNLKIDSQRAVTGGGGSPIETGGAGAAPSLPRPAAPAGLTVDDVALVQSAVTPKAAAQLSWTPPAGASLAGYLVQWSLDPTFTTGVIGEDVPADRRTTTVPGLPASQATTVTVYFRIAAVARGGLRSLFSAVVSAAMPGDTSAPGPVTGLTVGFAVDGTLEVRATPPTSSNYKHMAVRVLNAAGTIEWDTGQFVAGVWSWSPERNKLRTAGVWARSVLVEVKAVSWSNISSTAVTAAATMPVPGQPGGFGHSWASDDGTAAADLVVIWTPVAGMRYFLAVDGIEREVIGGWYALSVAQNGQEHSGTPDKALSLSLVAQDGLEQRGAAVSATATNAAPPATTVSTQGTFTALSIAIVASAARDLDRYRVRVYKDSALVDTFFTRETDPAYQAANGNGSYQVDVTVYDLFGSASAPSALSTAATLEDASAFAASLRAGARYRDSLGTNPDTLKAALADGNRTSGGIAYS